MRQLEGRDVITCAGLTAAVVVLLEWLARYSADQVFLEEDVGEAVTVLLKWALMIGAAAGIPRICYQRFALEGWRALRAVLPVAALAGLAGALLADAELLTKLADPVTSGQALGAFAAQVAVRIVAFLVAGVAGAAAPGAVPIDTRGWWAGDQWSPMQPFAQGEVEATCERARGYYERGNLAFAETEYRKALLLDSGSVDAHLGLGYVAIYLSKHGVAEQEFNHVFSLGGRDAEAHAGLGYAALLRRQYSAAREEFERGLDCDADCVPALVGMGQIHMVRGDYQAALPEFQRAVEVEPGNANAQDGLGAAHLGLERYHEALQALDRAIQLRPEDADAYYRRGLAYSEVGDRERALRDWARALELAPRAWFAEELRGELEGGDGIDDPDQV